MTITMRDRQRHSQAPYALGGRARIASMGNWMFPNLGLESSAEGTTQ